jgi:DNA helicase IV
MTDPLATDTQEKTDPLDTNRSAAIAEEQLHLDRAHAALAAMRARAQTALEQAKRDSKDTSDRDDAAAIEAALLTRLENLAESRAALCFGRIDEDMGPGRDPDRWHIGRRHVEGPDGEPMVLDWRVPVAVPFYRATWADPQGLRLRRRLAVDSRVVAGLFDEDFTDPEGADEGGGVPDPLLAELERSRSGEMRDIVATIQAEQDVIIRAGLRELVIVQGGPGTGKTAVGLHRAAFLLYEHRKALEKLGLLVVGPNDLFLRYIGQVLPSLGERAVTQTTVERLYGFSIAKAVETDDQVARLKGDKRMAVVIRNWVLGQIKPISADVEIPNAFALLVVPADEANQVLKDVAGRDLPTNDGREVLRAQMMALCWRIYLRRQHSNEGHNESFQRDLKARPEFKKLIDSMWPAFTAAGVVRTLLGSPAALAVAADGVLSVDEQRLLRRKKARSAKDERWTRHDLALLDEARALVGGLLRTYGHVVVDEAQDLSDMELRMAGRRAADRSMTILGDLAQATAAGAQRDWVEAVDHLRADYRGTTEHRIAELTLGYRVPAPILEVANQLLPIAAPHVVPSRSVRVNGREPVRAERHELAAQVQRLRAAWTTVGVIAPVAEIDEVLEALADVAPADARHGQSLDEGVTVLGAVASKGLEFDAIVVVEPNRIVAELADGRGHRALYVALTRAVQELVIAGAASIV